MNDTTQNLEHKNICNKKSRKQSGIFYYLISIVRPFFTYQVNGTSFVVQPIFKEKSFETLGSVLLRLMTSSE